MDKNRLFENIFETPNKLSEKQREAVLSKQNTRIIAGAGTGKTETLTRKIVYLLMYEGADPSSIVAFTFTEKAAQSMKSRVFDRAKRLGGDEFCTQLGDMYVGTIHGYCSRILEDHFGYGDYGVLDENQETAFLMRVGWELGLGSGGSYSRNCRHFADTLDVVYSEMIPDEKLKECSRDFYDKYKKYEEILDNHKLLTFDRMIKLAIDNLSNKPETLNQVKYLIVDEYQDINRAQEMLIRIIGAKGKTFIVGDPRQTIYQWRGSDERCFEDFTKYHPDAKTIPIRENRRSKRLIIDVANEFSDTFETGQYEHIEPVSTEDGGVYLAGLSSDAQEAEWIADQIRSYVDGGKCSYKDIGVLFRSVNTSAPLFIDVFRRRGVPFVIGGKVGLFRRSDVQAVAKLCAWLYEDGFFQKNKWAMEERIMGDTLLETALTDWHDGVPGVALPDDIDHALREWKSSTLNGKYENFTEVYQVLLVILGFKQLDPDNSEHAVIMANLGRFNSLLTDYETSNMIGGRKRNWNRDLKGLCWFMNLYATSSYEEQEGDDMGGVNAIQLMTVHQAKGLEWSVVFIPSMIMRRFPSSMVGRRGHWLLPRNLFDVEKYEGDIESERKLLYVALTRAKDVLVISYFKEMNGNLIEASDFVTDDLDTGKMVALKDEHPLPLRSVTTGGDPDEIRTYTAGEVITYGRCPYLYRFRHVWGYQPGLKERLGYGNTLHFCMRGASELIKQGYNPLTAVVSSINENFNMPFINKTISHKIKDAARKKLARFVNEHREDMLRIKEVESRIEFPLHKAILTGRVDVILHDGGNLEIRDYKTSDRVVTQEEVELQIRLYTLGLTMLGEPVTKGSVAYLEDASIAQVDVSREQIERAQTVAEEYINGIINHDFKPRPDKHCGQCDYKKICRHVVC